MTRRFGLHWIGPIITIGIGSWMACNNGTGPPTVPAPPAEESSALQEAAASSTTMARVAETAALTDDVPPWHRLPSRRWRELAKRRRPTVCADTKSITQLLDGAATCGRNSAYFLQFLTISAASMTVLVSVFPDPNTPIRVHPEETPPQETEPEITEPEETEPESGMDPDVWIYGTSPSKETELCEGDYIHVIGVSADPIPWANFEDRFTWMDPEMEETVSIGKKLPTLCNTYRLKGRSVLRMARTRL